jgi:hypothetical protein
MYSECSLPLVEEYTITFPKSKPAPTLRTVSGKEPFKMVHFSDIHVDLSYDPGTSYTCTYESAAEQTQIILLWALNTSLVLLGWAIWKPLL